MKYYELIKLLFLGFVLFLNISCSGTVLNINNYQNNINNPQQIIDEIEKRGIFIQNPADLKNVYYLTKIDSLSDLVGVAYFLEWENEFPDFGKTFKTSNLEIFYQIIIPLFYTNWLYIPNSGGLQRILYGKHDIEGIWVIYSLSNDSLSSLEFMAFELPGHKITQFSITKGNQEKLLVLKNNAPFVKVASWNHLFEQPNEQDYVQHYFPIPFPIKKWENYKMNNQRAEIVKKYLDRFANK